MPLRNDLVVELIDDELLVLDLKNDDYFGIDEVGAEIFRLLQDDADIETISAHIVATFDIDMATAHADTTDFIGMLTEHGLYQ